MTPGLPALRTTVERSGSGRVTVRACGELDLATAPALRRALAEAAGSGPVDVVVDVSALAFVDAAGLGALLQAAERVRAGGGQLRLAAPSRMLRRVLRLLDLEARLPVEPAQNSVGVPDSSPRSAS